MVIGLQSTGEKNTEESVKRSKSAGQVGMYNNSLYRVVDYVYILYVLTIYIVHSYGQGDALDDFAEPSRDILLRAIKASLPDDYETEALLEKAEALVLPPNPLDRLIESMGGEAAVAEMSGRKKRLARQEGGDLKVITAFKFKFIRLPLGTLYCPECPSPASKRGERPQGALGS